MRAAVSDPRDGLLDDLAQGVAVASTNLLLRGRGQQGAEGALFGECEPVVLHVTLHESSRHEACEGSRCAGEYGLTSAFSIGYKTKALANYRNETQESSKNR